MEFTGSALVTVLIIPLINYLKKHSKFFDEVPAATFVLMGVLVYGVTVVYTGMTTGAWVFAGSVLFTMVLNNAWVAVGGKVVQKTYSKLKAAPTKKGKK